MDRHENELASFLCSSALEHEIEVVHAEIVHVIGRVYISREPGNEAKNE